jgi:hypothetical protein
MAFIKKFFKVMATTGCPQLPQGFLIAAYSLVAR